MSASGVKELSQSIPGDIRRGIHAGVPIALGYLPIAIAFGILAKSAMTPFGITTLMSGLVFAGASQFVAVQMLMTGTSLIKIVLLTFILNLRLFLMSATLSTRIQEKSSGKLSLVAFGITDETFSVATLSQDKLTFKYMLGLNFTAYFAWVVGTIIGYIAGAGLPVELQNSMGIALYAMFVGLLIPSVRASKSVAIIVIVAAILNSIFMLFLQAGTAIILTTILTAGLAALLLPEKGSDA